MFRYLLIISLMLSLSACGTSPKTNFYVLNSDYEPPAQGDEGVSVGVLKATLPILLDRSEIVTRDGQSKIAEKSEVEVINWTARQSYIALSNAMLTSAELKIDTCPIEGFDPSQYDKILKLSEKGLTAACVLTLGYRSDEDKSQFAKKVRKSKEDLFEIV